MPIESVCLRYVGGSSNKVYNMQLEQSGDLFEVNAQNGRYGGTLISRKVTKGPVSLEEARKVYQKKLKEQLAEGYTADGTGTPFAGTDRANEVSGLVPQLLNPIEESMLDKYILDDDWMAEEKMDGFHIMAEASPEGLITGSNRRGLVIPISSIIEKDCQSLLNSGGVIDGEAIGDAYWVFDLLSLAGKDIRNLSADRRHEVLTTLFTSTSPKEQMRLVKAYYGAMAKRELLNSLRARRAEGIVFKRRAAPYVPGRPNSGGDMVKFKFWAPETTFAVVAQHKTKRSVEVGALKDGKLVSVGNVTVPSNYAIPDKGSMVEVVYLYAYPNGGSLYQPQYKGLRIDKTEPDEYSTLKFKAEGSSDVDVDS